MSKRLGMREGGGRGRRAAAKSVAMATSPRNTSLSKKTVWALQAALNITIAAQMMRKTAWARTWANGGASAARCACFCGVFGSICRWTV